MGVLSFGAPRRTLSSINPSMRQCVNAPSNRDPPRPRAPTVPTLTQHCHKTLPVITHTGSAHLNCTPKSGHERSTSRRSIPYIWPQRRLNRVASIDEGGAVRRPAGAAGREPLQLTPPTHYMNMYPPELTSPANLPRSQSQKTYVTWSRYRKSGRLRATSTQPSRSNHTLCFLRLLICSVSFPGIFWS